MKIVFDDGTEIPFEELIELNVENGDTLILRTSPSLPMPRNQFDQLKQGVEKYYKNHKNIDVHVLVVNSVEAVELIKGSKLQEFKEPSDYFNEEKEDYQL